MCTKMFNWCIKYVKNNNNIRYKKVCSLFHSLSISHSLSFNYFSLTTQHKNRSSAYSSDNNSSSDEDYNKIKNNNKTRSRSKSINKEDESNIIRGLKITGLPSRNISKYLSLSHF